MKLQINGDWQEIEGAGMSVADLLLALKLERAPVAIAVNMECIPRGLRAETTLQEGDSVEILSPQQGG